MSVATVDAQGQPHVRMCLLKKFDERGFVFYTNLHSQKAQHIETNNKVALCFYWPDIDKQVRITGSVSLVPDSEADEYFASRPLKSQLGAWASKQSQVMKERLELEKRVAKYAIKFAKGKVPRPEFWSGFRLIPHQIEFWHERPFRLHDRYRLEKDLSGNWMKENLFP